MVSERSITTLFFPLKFSLREPGHTLVRHGLKHTDDSKVQILWTFGLSFSSDLRENSTDEMPPVWLQSIWNDNLDITYIFFRGTGPKWSAIQSRIYLAVLPSLLILWALLWEAAKSEKWRTQSMKRISQALPQLRHGVRSSVILAQGQGWEA